VDQCQQWRYAQQWKSYWSSLPRSVPRVLSLGHGLLLYVHINDKAPRPPQLEQLVISQWSRFTVRSYMACVAFWSFPGHCWQ
jgi:hypothetical protein